MRRVTILLSSSTSVSSLMGTGARSLEAEESFVVYRGV